MRNGQGLCLAIPFLGAVVAGSVASGTAMAILSLFVGARLPQSLVDGLAGLGVAAAVSAPVVFVAGLLALPLERLLLREVSAPRFFLFAATAGVAASLVAEKIIFFGPYASFGALAVPAFAASLAAGTLWWAAVRKREHIHG